MMEKKHVILKVSSRLGIAFIFALVIVTLVWWFRDALFCRIGGEITKVPYVTKDYKPSSFTEFAQKEYPNEKVFGDFKKGMLEAYVWRESNVDNKVIRSIFGYPIVQRFVQGFFGDIICLVIYVVFLSAVFYILIVRYLPPKCLPILRNEKKSFRKVKELIDKEGDNLFEHILNEKSIKGTYLWDRIASLKNIYDKTKDRHNCLEANETYSEVEQAEVHYALMPLVFAEFLLPILGFVGTVVGVSIAISSLRGGMGKLFELSELNQAVLHQFMQGFDGLVLAFDTTLYGLVGLGVVGFLNFWARRSAFAVIAEVDSWSTQVLMRIDGENQLTDMNKTLHRLTDGLVITDADGKPSSRLTKPIQTIINALMETDKNGDPTADGQVIPSLKQLLKLIQDGLFVIDKDGAPTAMPQLNGVADMIGNSTVATQSVHNALMHSIYQIVGVQNNDVYAKLTTYVKDKQTGENISKEVDGYLRNERMHSQLLQYLTLLFEKQTEQLKGGSSPVENSSVMDTNGREIISKRDKQIIALTAGGSGFVAIHSTSNESYECIVTTGELVTIASDLSPILNEEIESTFVQTVSYSSDGSLVSYSPDGGVSHTWQIHDDNFSTIKSVFCNGDVLAELKLRGTPNLSANNIHFLDEGRDGTLKLCSLPINGVGNIAVVHSLTGKFLADAIGNNGVYAFAVDGKGKKYELHIVSENNQISTIQVNNEPAVMAYSSNGTLLVGFVNGSITLYDGENKPINIPASGLNSRIEQMALSNSGDIYIVAETSKKKLIRLSKSGQNMSEIEYDEAISAICASRDGRYLFVGLNNGVVYGKNI